MVQAVAGSLTVTGPHVVDLTEDEFSLELTQGLNNPVYVARSFYACILNQLIEDCTCVCACVMHQNVVFFPGLEHHVLMRAVENYRSTLICSVDASAHDAS